MDGTVPTFFESCSPHTGDWPPDSPNQCAFVISPLRVDRAHRPHNETSGEALPMCYGVLAERATLTVEELTHIAEFLISRIQQVFYRLVRQHYQLAVQDGIQQPRRGFVVGMRAGFRLRYDLVDDAKFFQIGRRDFERHRGRLCLG